MDAHCTRLRAVLTPVEGNTPRPVQREPKPSGGPDALLHRGGAAKAWQGSGRQALQHAPSIKARKQADIMSQEKKNRIFFTINAFWFKGAAFYMG